MKIYIVEDDREIGNALKKELESWNYEVQLVREFNKVVEEFQEFEPHLVLMDLMLPYNNGFYWCQEIRKISNVPIIFVSSKDDNMNIVMAMQFGADDYITKPIDLGVTVAKIGAMMRRTYDFAPEITSLSFSGVEVSLSKSEVRIGERSETLTRTELAIMESLIKGKGNIVSRESIMEKCWQGDDFIDDNTLAVNMTRLRKKLRKLGIDNFIETKKGQGYYLANLEEDHER